MQWRCGYHFVEALMKRGFERIGSGLFSDVLAKPGSDRVVKVYTYGSQGEHATDPWPEYVLWAAQNGYAGTHAPRVFSFKIVNGTMGTFYVAVMERLEATMAQLRGPSSPDPRYSLLTPLTHHYSGAYNREEADAAVPGFYDFYRHFREAFRGRGTDLHDGNFMVQGVRLVLTDPLSGGGTSTSRRWRVSRDGALQQLAA
jgi:hypothetical protein